MSIKCPQCSAELPDRAKFCGVCGCRLDAIETVAEGTPAPSEKTEPLVNPDAPTGIQSPADEKTERIQPEQVPVPGEADPTIASVPTKASNADQSIPAVRGIAVPESKFPLKALLAIVPVALVCAAAIITTVILLNTNPEIKTENYLNSAAKYLIDTNYEQAIIAFDKVLEIDPMNVEAYLGKARVYHAMGELDKALDTLRDGYEKTGDERIWSLLKEYEGELYVEPTYETFKTSFARLGSAGEGYPMGFGEDELWYFIDKTGQKLSQTGYKFVNGFVGTGDKAYAIAGLPDDRTILINSQFQEILDLTGKPKPILFNTEDPLILCYHYMDYTVEDDYAYIEIIKPDGTKIYTWKQNEGISGNGADAKTDPLIPQDMKEDKCDDQFHQNLWIDKMEVELSSVSCLSTTNDVYLYFVISSKFEYDHAPEDAYIEEKKRQDRENSGFGLSGGAYNGHGHMSVRGCEYQITYDGSKISLIESGIVVTKTEDYSISYSTRLATSILNVELTDSAGSKYATLCGYYSEIIPQISSFYYDLCLENVFKCRKEKKAKDDPDKYALFEPKWYDTPDEAHDKIDSEWKQISADYDNMGTYDEDTDTLLVQKGDKWGYIDSSGNELAMFDDAASFSGGFAVVTESGRGRVINADFEQIGEDFECESAYSIDKGVFAVSTGGTCDILVVNF